VLYKYISLLSCYHSNLAVPIFLQITEAITLGTIPPVSICPVWYGNYWRTESELYPYTSRSPIYLNQVRKRFAGFNRYHESYKGSTTRKIFRERTVFLLNSITIYFSIVIANCIEIAKFKSF
jgi:hypothetical protein